MGRNLVKFKIWSKGKFRTSGRFEILGKMPLFFSSIMIFSPALPQELATMAIMNDLSSIF